LAAGRFAAARLAAGWALARPSSILSPFGSADFAGEVRRAAAFRFAAGRARVALAAVAVFLAAVVDLRAGRPRDGVASEALPDARLAGALEVVFFAPPVRAVLLDIIDVVSRFAATRRRLGRGSAIRVPPLTAAASGSTRVAPLSAGSAEETRLARFENHRAGRARTRATCHARARLGVVVTRRRAVRAQPPRPRARQSALAALRLRDER
jgi:hypothetical protein